MEAKTEDVVPADGLVADLRRRLAARRDAAAAATGIASKLSLTSGASGSQQPQQSQQAAPSGSS